MRAFILSIIIVIAFSESGKAQYEIYIKSILKLPSALPEQIPGEFVMKKNGGKKDDGYYYEFSNLSFPISYYSPTLDCGYFKLFDKHYLLNGQFKEGDRFGCDLDGETLRVFQLTIGGRRYFIVASIAVSNGRGTRNEFFQLFDVTDERNIMHYPLWSVYGSRLSFGDYNEDGKLDFLEISNDRDNEGNDTFKMKLKTLNKEYTAFEYVTDKLIVFKQEYVPKQPPKITIIKRWW